MKKLIFLLLLVSGADLLHAQSVAIGNTVPDSSAILDITSSSKGILLPRVHLTGIYDTNTIHKPATSLLVYNTNTHMPAGAGYYAWSGKSWDVLLSTGNIYTKGKNRYTIVSDSVEREYWVHVPSDYDSVVATPLVFMLHGTGGNGEKFYDNSGWKELGEEENFISVFPSAFRYKIYDLEDGTNKNTTKWNTKPDAAGWVFQPGERGRDDIKFFRDIITELSSKLNIDSSRIYVNGFSSGGSMAAKCAIDLSDKLAAVAHSAASFQKDTVYTPLRKIPVLFQLGNKDYGPGVAGGPEIPLIYFDSLISTPGIPILNGKHYRIARRHIDHLGLDSNYTLIGNTDSVMVALYHSLTPGDTLNVFRYVFVKELSHKYPNGENHWFDAPRAHWAWLRQYRRP
jgi:polyhydroxybutyrate depolymerase